MWTGILQILEFVLNHRVHLFLIFYLLSWGIFALRFLSAKKNKLYQNDPIATSISAIVLSFHDRPEYLYKSLNSIAKQRHRFDEVLLAMDHDDYKINKDVAWAYSEAFDFKIVYDMHGNKRTAFAKAFKQSSGRIIYILAGDTIYPRNTTIETLRPFVDPKVGATTIRQRIYDRERTFARRFADIMYNLRFRITYPAISSKGVLICTTGEIGAFRREILEKHVDDFLNETFMGKKCILGDDRYLTSMVLKEGYSVVMQPAEETVYTDAPDTFKGLVKQQLRWYRSGQKYTLKTLFLNWIPRKSLMLRIHCFALQIMPYFFGAVIIWGILNSFYRWDPVLIMSHFPAEPILLWISGFYLSMIVKTYSHLKDNKRDWLIFPLYAVFVAVVMLLVYAYALITIHKQGDWLTKSRSIPVGAKRDFLSFSCIPVSSDRDVHQVYVE
jgi:cellulose synthase/poly-beta-1,6-N-acetylglucosamine synthase-like glycosyltransferase